jgi:hypothetical protein
MADYSAEIEGSAIAAFTLAQLAFWHQINTGALPKDQAVGMLKQAVEANLKGGLGNQSAAQKLQAVLDFLQRPQRPGQH